MNNASVYGMTLIEKKETSVKKIGLPEIEI